RAQAGGGIVVALPLPRLPVVDQREAALGGGEGDGLGDVAGLEAGDDDRAVLGEGAAVGDVGDEHDGAAVGAQVHRRGAVEEAARLAVRKRVLVGPVGKRGGG